MSCAARPDRAGAAVVLLFALAVSAGCGSGEEVRTGPITFSAPEFAVEHAGFSYQRIEPGRAVSHHSDGSFVVVWRASVGADRDGVFARLYDSAGVAAGGEFRLSSETSNTLRSNRVAVDHNPDGSFVVAWSGLPAGSPASSSDYQPLARVFDSAGMPAIAEVSAGTIGYFDFGTPLDVASTGSNGFVVVWSGSSTSYGDKTVYGQRFDSTGATVGTRFAVNTYTSGNHREPVVDSAGDGSFVVAWTNAAEGYNPGTRDGHSAGVLAQRFDSNGAKDGPELVVNTFTTYAEDQPSISVNAGGDFVVVWRTQYGDEGLVPDGQGGAIAVISDSVTFRRYNANGPLGDEVHLNSYTSGNQDRPSVTLADEGSFVVAWHSATAYNNPDNRDDGNPDLGGVFMRCFDSAGNGGGAEFHANTATPGRQDVPTVSGDGSGGFVVLWESRETFFPPGTPLARRFTVDPCDTTDVALPLTVVKDDGGDLWGVDPVIAYDIAITNDTGATTDISVTDRVPRKTSFVAAQSSAGWSCEGSGVGGDACTLTLSAVAPGEQRDLTFAVQVEDGTSPLWWVYNAVEATVQSSGARVVAFEPTAYGICDPDDFDPTLCSIACLILPDLCSDPAEGTLSVSAILAGVVRETVGYPELELRDNVLAEGRGGSRATDLYYEQSANAVAAAMSDPQVAQMALAAADEWDPLFVEMIAGNTDVTISQAAVDATMAFADTLRAAAGAELAAVLDRELARFDLESMAGISLEALISELDHLTCEGFEAELFCAEVNGDCEITATDALIILNIAVGTLESVAEADVNGSGGVSATDALQALAIAVGISGATDACNL